MKFQRNHIFGGMELHIRGVGPFTHCWHAKLFVLYSSCVYTFVDILLVGTNPCARKDTGTDRVEPLIP
jgi:hypothetical protein